MTTRSMTTNRIYSGYSNQENAYLSGIVGLVEKSRSETKRSYQTNSAFSIDSARYVLEGLPDNLQICYADASIMDDKKELCYVFIRLAGNQIFRKIAQHGCHSTWATEDFSKVLKDFIRCCTRVVSIDDFESFVLQQIPEHQRYNHV